MEGIAGEPCWSTSSRQQHWFRVQMFSTAHLSTAQAIALAVWFVVIAGCYALYIPVIQDAAVQAVVAAVYSIAAIVVTASYFVVSLIDPADQGCLAEESPCFCDQCQAYVHRGSKHCKECHKCVLGFDHHCKWVNNCIGSRNYKPFLALLSSMCSMLAVQLAIGTWLAMGCFTDAHATALRLVAAYPTLVTVQQYAAALMVYSSVISLALLPLGDLLLLHLVLSFRGITTWDYIMANRDAQIEPSPLSRNITKVFRYINLLGPRNTRVHDEQTAAESQKRKVGINPCLACRTQLSNVPSSAAQFEHFFRPERLQGFDAALIFTPRLSMSQEKQSEEPATTVEGTGQVLISVDTCGHNAEQGNEPSCLTLDADSTSQTGAAAVQSQQRQQQPEVQTAADISRTTTAAAVDASKTRTLGTAVRFAE